MRGIESFDVKWVSLCACLQTASGGLDKYDFRTILSKQFILSNNLHRKSIPVRLGHLKVSTVSIKTIYWPRRPSYSIPCQLTTSLKIISTCRSQQSQCFQIITTTVLSNHALKDILRPFTIPISHSTECGVLQSIVYMVVRVKV